MITDSNTIHLPANSRGVIIDAASFAAKPFQSPEANCAALFAVCRKLVNRDVPVMAVFDRKTLNVQAQANKRWAVLVSRFMRFYPHWFHRNLAGADVVDEIRRASVSLNATIISARLPLVYGQRPALRLEPHGNAYRLPSSDIRIDAHHELESAAQKLRRCLQYDNRYLRHLVWANQQAEQEAA